MGETVNGWFSELGSHFRSPMQYGTLITRTLKGTIIQRTTQILDPKGIDTLINAKTGRVGLGVVGVFFGV